MSGDYTENTEGIRCAATKEKDVWKYVILKKIAFCYKLNNRHLLAYMFI